MPVKAILKFGQLFYKAKENEAKDKLLTLIAQAELNFFFTSSEKKSNFLMGQGRLLFFKADFLKQRISFVPWKFIKRSY